MTARRIAYVEPWTSARVMHRLQEAAVSIRAVQGSAMPGQRTTYWPDVLRDPSEITAGAPTPRRAVASVEQIGRMDDVLVWISLYLSRSACELARMPADAGWLVWARAAGWSYARIGRARKAAWGGNEQRGGGRSLSIPGGNARPSLVKIERDALAYMAAELNKTRAEVDVEARSARPNAEPERGRSVPPVDGIVTIAPERGPPQYAHLGEEDADPVHARTRSMARR